MTHIVHDQQSNTKLEHKCANYKKYIITSKIGRVRITLHESLPVQNAHTTENANKM